MKRAVAIILVIIISVLVGFFVNKIVIGGKDKTDVIVNIDTIKEIAQLATIEYHMTIYEHVTEEHKWYEWKDAEILVILHGVVRGLIDLEKIDMNKSDDNRIITIKIPKDALRITNPEFGPDDIKVTTISNPNIFHKISDNDRNMAVKKGINDFKNKAIESGIEEKTLDEAKKVISEFLASLEYEVIFTKE